MGLNNWLTNIQDWFLPRLCPACHSWAGTGRRLCPGCEQTLPVITNACPRCASPYDHPDVHGECGVCQQDPPPFRRTLALYRYASPVDHFIRALKFHQQLGLAAWLGERLAERLVKASPHPDLIVPVPLHSSRLRRRGYNQALELARPVARALDVPLAARLLTRVRATAAQSDLPLTARGRNVKGAFAVRDSTAVQSRRIALVDDVMTSGSTLRAAAAALHAAGAGEIEVWVIARA